jgi:hypothetical protein
LATIKRHPVPQDSYNPDRPLNDLGRDQLKHFAHVEHHLPPKHRVGMPVPSPEDGPAATRFIAAVTAKLMEMRNETSLADVATSVQPGPVANPSNKTAGKKVAANKSAGKRRTP